MTLRIAGNPADARRPSGKVKAVAEYLDMARSHVRQLVDAGELEAHKVGKRGVRIYWDSVTDYQRRNARPVERAGRESAKPARRPSAVSMAADRAALASLKAAGCIKDDSS